MKSIEMRLHQDEDIAFINKPFVAVVEDKGEKPIECYPVIYNAPFTCGIGIFYEDGDGKVWGLTAPRDLIASWRATEIIQHITHIKDDTLCHAYYAGKRNVHVTEQYMVDEIIATIGKEKHDQIMNMAIPEVIIQIIIDGQDTKISPSLKQINDELRAGTIVWKPEFSNLGIEQPEEGDEQKKFFQDTVAQYEVLLASYAKHVSLPRKSIYMEIIEATLVDLIERNIKQSYADDVIVALAGVVGSLKNFEVTTMLIPSYCTISLSDYKYQFEVEKYSAIKKSAEWIVKTRSISPFLFWKKKHCITKNEACNLLEGIFTEYFSPPEEWQEKMSEASSI
ncbi:hypothetical protein M0R01_01740 [bacterium]|nr:hypothetical protein [bacterium]